MSHVLNIQNQIVLHYVRMLLHDMVCPSPVVDQFLYLTVLINVLKAQQLCKIFPKSSLGWCELLTVAKSQNSITVQVNCTCGIATLFDCLLWYISLTNNPSLWPYVSRSYWVFLQKFEYVITHCPAWAQSYSTFPWKKVW